MATRYVEHVAAPIPQTEPATPAMVANSGGGFAFAVDKWSRLDRFLVLGAERSYYASAQKLTRENAAAVDECLREDAARAVARIVEISEGGRAAKNDPAVFALALAASHPTVEARRAALPALAKVARTGTMLFQFVDAANELRGWGRSLKRGVAAWYLDKTVEQLAYQLVKYQSREKWSHRDVLRLAHPRGNKRSLSWPDKAGGEEIEQRQAVLRWAIGAELGERIVARRLLRPERLDQPPVPASIYPAIDAQLPPLIQAFEELKTPTLPLSRALELIRAHKMTHEMVGDWKKHDQVWHALSEHMPMHALVRNLGVLTARGVLAPMSDRAKEVAARLGDREQIKKARLHPLAILSALRVYKQGKGDKGKLTWSANRTIIDALDEAFYLAFDNVVPTGKRLMLALDVSGSMGGSFYDGSIKGLPGLTPREVSAALALVTARTEPNYLITGFADKFRELDISPRQRLDDVIKSISGLPFGSTDCALPMTWAERNKIDFDGFCVFTDNETNSSESKHPFIALRDYRSKTGVAAKLVVNAMTSAGFSIADPQDSGMLDVVGMDSAAPAIIADFIRE